MGAMTEIIFLDTLAALLLVSALAHFFIPQVTDVWLGKPLLIRLTGIVLLILALGCLHWHGWFIRTLAAALGISGFWRLFFPQNSIRTQQSLYPRWVHGCLLLAGAIAVWALRPKP
jgi:hypothetical protein